MLETHRICAGKFTVGASMDGRVLVAGWHAIVTTRYGATGVRWSWARPNQSVTWLGGKEWSCGAGTPRASTAVDPLWMLGRSGIGSRSLRGEQWGRAKAPNPASKRR